MSVRLLTGDAIAMLADLETGSVDACVTDPPYGLKFMGKAWDHGVPGEPYWREALCVLAPGAHLVAFGGTRTYHRLTCAIEDAGFEIRDCLMWLYGSGFPKGKACLKPGWEPIILARKPGRGAVLNVDGCRIEGIKGVPASPSRTDGALKWGNMRHETGQEDGHNPNVGRWPANVCLDEEAAALLDEQSGVQQSIRSARGGTSGNQVYGQFGVPTRYECGYADTGGASRFFLTVPAERFMYCPKASSRERGSYNDHPTVKPLALMQWLVRLVTPSGGIVLDPFCGSGSTLIAADREGFDAIGIDSDPHAVEIARRRLTEDAGPLFADELAGVRAFDDAERALIERNGRAV